jgi:hypothetical protein
MRTEQDVEAFLLRYKKTFTTLDGAPPTYWLSPGEGLPNVAVRVDAPIVIVRAEIGELKRQDNVKLLTRLLQLNAQVLMHSAYGLEGQRIVLSAALELENLDYNELVAVLDEIEVALSREARELHGLNGQ